MDLSYLMDGLGDGLIDLEQVVCMTAGYPAWDHERASEGVSILPPELQAQVNQLRRYCSDHDLTPYYPRGLLGPKV